MLTKEVMSKKPEYLSPTATLKEAADFMKKHDCGFVPIGENDRLIGTVTDRDLAIRGLLADHKATKLRDVMTAGITYCYETDPIEKAAEVMEKKQIRRLVVLNKDKRLTGILSLGDIATKSKNLQLSGEITNAVSHH
jgi:CBS domain-containing protein